LVSAGALGLPTRGAGDFILSQTEVRNGEDLVMSRMTLFRRRAVRQRVHSPKVRLHLEPLEARCLLSDYGLHTRSIVAADPTTGQVGVAVVSFPTGVPAIVPVGEPGVIVANQAFPSYADAQAIIRDIDHGDDAATALAKVLARASRHH
jgi:Family of unknown function (DUF1028)